MEHVDSLPPALFNGLREGLLMRPCRMARGAAQKGRVRFEALPHFVWR